MIRSYYFSSIKGFLEDESERILGILTKNSEFDVTTGQKEAWKEEIKILKEVLENFDNGEVIFEYDIPRLGKRVDTILLINGILFVLEFKIYSDKYYSGNGIEQVWDYALDLKNFQEASHNKVIIPILIVPEKENNLVDYIKPVYNDKVYNPFCVNIEVLPDLIKNLLIVLKENVRDTVDDSKWIYSRYSPTPTIIQAASYMYKNHNVENITRTEASGKNLQETTNRILEIAKQTKDRGEKAICFVTGVLGAGKTLVGLNVAIQQFTKDDCDNKEMAVYLSGNGPLVDVLTESLARDKKRQCDKNGEKCKIDDARREVKSFIQMIYHYRNDYLAILKQDENGIVCENGKLKIDDEKYQKLDGSKFEGIENIAIFDEAQRAWTKDALASWLKRKKNIINFPYSEPEFLIWSLDLRNDWALIICLVGGGQEINTGEAGITEWIDALNNTFKNWKVYISPQITEKEYDEGQVIEKLKKNPNLVIDNKLHLSVSMRSFRAENLSNMVHDILDFNLVSAINEFNQLKDKYPIRITRNLDLAKKWLKENARGSERFGIICSSQAYRLKPLAIDVRVNPDTVHWFLDEKDDIRSSQFLEDVCTEFQVQGLELDWSCVVWDADFRYSKNGWINKEFVNKDWRNINKEERKLYQKNAYRVLLTRARQGMIICIPKGDKEDKTRLPEYYDETYNYLKNIGFEEI